VPQFRHTAEIRAPQEQVFTYVTTPSHWPSWYVACVSVSGDTDHSLEPGEQVIEEFRIGRRRGVATWTVRERIEPSRWVIAGTVAGGGDGTITYTLASRAGVTTYQREFAYRMPNPLLGLLDRLVLRPRLEADARLSVRRLKEALETGAIG
jgi:uncharacterized protein YndB with AHSA1/START domain